jgi:L-asparaginase
VRADGVPRIALIQTGGTIDSVGVDRLDLAWYTEAQQRLPPGELVARVPELASVAELEEIVFRRLPSHALTDADWLELSALLESVLERVEGVVVTHGTNTLEETAYWVSLTVHSERPVVLVGAMRPASGLGADGYLNLLNAVRVAADPSARGHGALVVLDDAIFAARDVTKTATFRVETFDARDLGALGYADADGRVIFWHRSLKRHTLASEFSVAGLAALPRVDVALSYVGADGSAIDAFVGAGARGIVSAGTGAGRPTPLEDAALDRAVAHGVVVVQSSRVGSGRVVRSPGLRGRGIVAGDNLVPWKARVLLALALTRTTDADAVQAMFDTY